MRRPLFAAVVCLAAASAVVGCGQGGGTDHGSTSQMDQMKLADAPQPVRDAIKRDYPGGTVTYLAKHEMGEKTHYHVELTTADGKTVYHTYSPSGTDMSDPH